MGYRLEKRESIRAAVRRIAREQIDGAIADLADDAPAVAIHQARKRFKKIRGLLRLVRGELGAVYAHENVWYRDTARRLATARDADVMAGAFDELVKQLGEQPTDQRWQPIRDLVAAHRFESVEAQKGLAAQLTGIRADLRQARLRLDDWAIVSTGFGAVSPGLVAVYRRARKAYAAARDNPLGERLHEWRKQSKYHWYHVRLLERIDPGALKRRRRRLRRLTELLGNDHDLALLRRRLLEQADALGSCPGAARQLLDALDRRRGESSARALALGRRAYKLRPNQLRRRWQARFETWWIGAV